MKIIGFTYYDGRTEMVLKGDSCILNGRKPFFLPDWSKEVVYSECMIIRVSRLGKEIGLPFASRYYDAVAPGYDFAAMDVLRSAQQSGKPWTQAIGFDYSLAIGEFIPVSDERKAESGEFVMSTEEAIVAASKVMTIRQGDLIYIHKVSAPRAVVKEEELRTVIDGAEKLYCKIK